jgi:hypothetical protein
MKAGFEVEEYKVVKDAGLRELVLPHRSVADGGLAPAPNGNGAVGAGMTVIRLSNVLWQDPQGDFWFSICEKTAQQAAARGFTRCAVKILPLVSVSAPAPPTPTHKVRVPKLAEGKNMTCPQELFQDEGKLFIERMETEWEDSGETYDAMYMWTLA